MTGLPQLHTVLDVATALHQTERYVQEKCRLREWPHRRLARGQVVFTDDDFDQVLALCSSPVTREPRQQMSWAPRSARRPAVRRTA